MPARSYWRLRAFFFLALSNLPSSRLSNAGVHQELSGSVPANTGYRSGMVESGQRRACPASCPLPPRSIFTSKGGDAEETGGRLAGPKSCSSTPRWAKYIRPDCSWVAGHTICL